MAFQQACEADLSTKPSGVLQRQGHGLCWPCAIPSRGCAGSRVGQGRKPVAEIGPESLPNTFLQAAESGNVATDLTGKHVFQVLAQFSGRHAP
jgi:hypothetical protein